MANQGLYKVLTKNPPEKRQGILQLKKSYTMMSNEEKDAISSYKKSAAMLPGFSKLSSFILPDFSRSAIAEQSETYDSL